MLKSYGVKTQAKKNIRPMSALAYLAQLPAQFRHVEASEVTHHGKAANPALLLTKTTAFETKQDGS